MSEVCKDFYALSVMGEVCQKNCKVNSLRNTSLRKQTSRWTQFISKQQKGNEMDYYYTKLTKQNTTDYYNMIESEYKRLTSHIITFYTTLLERGVINGKRESLTAFVERLACDWPAFFI